MFYLLGEPGYSSSNWYKHILDGIITEKRTKRFNVVMLNSILELENFAPKRDDAILLVGSNLNWLESVIDICIDNFGKNIIVLGNFENLLKG